MNQIIPTIKLLTTQEDQATYINCLIINHNSNNYHLHGSTGNIIYAFSESICLYVLSMNRALCTMGLYAFMSAEPDYINSICLHSHQEIKQMLGHQWESMEPMAIVQKLIKHLY